VLSEPLWTAYRDLVDLATRGLPRAVGGVLAVVGLVLTAKIVARWAAVVCRRVRIDGLAESSGLTALLKRVGVSEPASSWIPRLVYAGLLMLFAQTAATVLGLTPIADSIRAFFAYLPNVVAALVILLAGMAAADFAGGAVRRAAQDSGIDVAPTLGSLASALILFVSGIMAVSQLQIDTDMIRIVTICALGGLALAFALSLGLGSRDVTRGMIAGFYARKQLKPGDQVTVSGRVGRLVTITPTQTLIDTSDGTVVAVPNAVYLESLVEQRAAPHPPAPSDRS
jgi:small-conductance mechanosensitive channel